MVRIPSSQNLISREPNVKRLTLNRLQRLMFGRVNKLKKSHCIIVGSLSFYAYVVQASILQAFLKLQFAKKLARFISQAHFKYNYKTFQLFSKNRFSSVYVQATLCQLQFLSQNLHQIWKCWIRINYYSSVLLGRFFVPKLIVSTITKINNNNNDNNIKKSK